jgi:hypothetical protein
MPEVAQEEASTPVKAVAVEVETEAPAAVAKDTPLKEVVAAVEAEAPVAVSKTKRALKNVGQVIAAEAKAEEEKVRVAITAEEHNIGLRLENQFLQFTTQIAQLQKQMENIQKQYPEYVKGLGTKYALDLTKYTFNAIEGVFTKNQ